VGGTVQTREIDAVVTLGSISVEIALLTFAQADDAQATSASSGPTIPSLLGRDLLSHFALLVDPQRDRLLLLEPEEADALTLP
jgi:hypothetical protein